MEQDDLRETVERLRNEKRMLIAQRDENQQLVEYVKKERSLQERREQRMDAPVWLRTKWWLLGKGDS